MLYRLERSRKTDWPQNPTHRGWQKEQVQGVFKLDRLETLDISRCEIGVGLFRTAATLKLCDLSLLDCEVADLRGLDQLNALEKLDLSGSIRTDAAINELAGLTGLTSLVLDFCNVTTFKAFLGCGDLEHLSLASTEIIDVSLIGRFTHLKELSLAGTSVADLAPLQELSKLTTLDLSWTKPLDLSPIAYLNDLRFIDFTGADLPDLTPFVRSAVPRQIAVDSKSLTSNQRRMLLNASEIEIVERLLK